MKTWGADGGVGETPSFILHGNSLEDAKRREERDKLVADRLHQQGLRTVSNRGGGDCQFLYCGCGKLGHNRRAAAGHDRSAYTRESRDLW